MLQKYNIEMATLKEVYDAFKADGAPLPDTYEDFEKYMTSGPDNGYEHRKQWYDAFKADGAPLPDTYEDFSRALFKVEADEKPAQTARATQPSQSAEPAPKPATRYFKLRRGGEDFTVTTDEVNAAGGLGAWAKAHPGAPVRVYMQGKNEDGTDFNGHVDLSVAHDRNKRLGYKYSTYSHPIVNKPQKSWTPTTQQKIAMSHQLHQMQKQADDMLEQSRERTKNVSEYYRDNRDSGFHAVEGKPTYNSRTGKVEKTYLTPTGDRTTDKNLADMEAQEARAQYEFNNRMKAAGLNPSNDMDVNRQMIADRLKENEARLKELYAEREVERYGERAGDTGWDKFVRTFGGAVNRGVTANAPTPEQNLTERDKEIKDLLAENDMLSEAKRTLDAGRDLKQSGGFMGGFFDVKNNAKNITRGLTDVAESADTYLSGVMSLHNAERLDIIKDKVDKGVELTDSELNLVYAAMLNQDASSSVKLPHGYTAGKVTGEMLPFMIQMALNPASGLGRALTKKFGTTALKRIAASVAGDVAEAAVLSNSLQAPRTIADIRNRHRGEITEHDGKIGFVGGESLPMAIYKGEASSIIENYTELLGSHFGAIGKGIWRGVDKGARKLGAGKVMDNVSRMVNNIKASDWAKGIANIESRAQWNGTIGEVMEEEAGIVLNSIFTGDNKLSDLVDAEQQIDIVLGVGLFGGFVSGIKTAGYPIARAHANSNLRKKDSEGAQQFSSDKWAAIKEQIDTSEDEALAQTVLSMVKVNGHSQEQQRAIIEYAAALTKARGYNLADASRKQEPQTEADSAQDEVDTAFNEGYEAATPQQMADAQNMFEYQRKRAEDILADQQLLDILDSNPVGALMGMTQTGMYTQEEIDAARDYANAKTVRDGILQRVTDDIDERIAQSDAMINGRVNRETGSILSATMDLDDRQVYIVGGEVVMNPDGTIDYDASDESLVVRDAVTGELEFTAPKSIVKVGEAIDPEAEKANAADNIRQQAAQAAANALNGTLAFNPGDVVRINDGGGLTDVTIVGPVVDEESGMPVESQLTVQFPNGQQTAFTKEQLQAFADAANLERLNQYEQERAAQRAQQRGAAEVEATRPAFALNDEFTILNDDGTPIHGSITGELDEDGMVEIYTEEPINGNKVNRFMPGELEGMFDTYNGAAIATAAPEDSEGGESSAEAAVQNHSSEAEAEQPETALGRIPLGENGKPDFGAVDAETAWDGLVEKYEGNKGRAQGFAANMVKIKEAALKKAEKVKSKPTEDPDEWDAAEQERENAIEQARLELEHWQSVAGVDEKRQAAVRAQQEAERAEAERAEREAAEAEKKRKAALDKRLHDTYEDVKDVPEAVEVLEDMDPRDIYEAAAQLLSGQKVLWGDAGVKVGARSETGFGEEERRRLFGLFASEANGGKSLSRLAEDAMKQQCETYGIPYDNQDARNALIDVISGARTVGDIRNYIANNRIDEARRLAEAKRRHEEEQYDEFCRQEYHLSAEEVEAYEDQLLAELSERDREFDANEYNDYIADEMARAAEITEQQKNGTEDNDTRRGSTPGDRRVQENDTEGKGTVPGRGYEVLPESRADQSSGAAADGDRSGIQPADGVQSDGPASAVAQGAQRGGIADVGRRKADDSPYGGLAEEVTSAIGPFGKIYTQFRGKPREAVTFLLAKRDGEAIGALHHKDVGEIDLVWGEEGSAHSDGFGLAKLAKYHPEVLFNLQEILNDMAVTKRSANRVQLESEKYKAAVRLTWDNQKKTWLLTMFGKKNSVLDNTTDTDKTHMGNGNDTATPENTVVSDRKDNDSASDKQASGEESLPQLSDDKRKPGLQAAVEAASAEVNTEPTEAQKKAGNYKKGHVTIGSFDITIENPAGSVRRGVDADGKEWSTTMANAYGEIRGTQSVDGDPIDVFLATDMDAWNGRKVFVVDQTNTDGSFDEHKVMLGFNSSEEAIKAYLANYDDSWAKTHPGLRISEVSLDDFKKWVASSHRKGKAFADYASVSKVAKVADIADRGSDAAKAAGPEQKDDASDSAAVSNQGDPQFVNAPSSDLLAKLTDEEREAIEDYFEEYQSVEIRCLTSEEEIDSSELSAEARDELHRLYDDGENLAAYCRENKKIYIFAGRVAADSLMYTLVHENTHAAIDAVRAEAETVLPKIVEQIADVALNKKRTFGDLYDAIKGEYPSEEAAEELLAYAIQRGEMRPDVRAALLDALDPQTRKFVEDRILKRIYGKEKLQTVYGVRQLSSEDYGNDERGRYAGHSRSSEEAGGERFEAGEGKKSASDKPITPSGNRLVSEERYQELKKRMIQKFGGQFNMGVDPEILAIGTEMAVYHIEKGARKFAAYAKAMIADLGDFIRPYLKSFYNAVRDMPEAEAAGLVADMDSYEDVRRVDIANFDKTGVDAMATAAAVVAEQEAETEREEAEVKLKEERKKKPGKSKSKPVTDGGLFDMIDGEPTAAPSPADSEQRHGGDLMGDSAAFQRRENQIKGLVAEVGLHITERVNTGNPLTMREVKKMAQEYSELAELSDTDLQELVELAMTKLARTVARKGIDGTSVEQKAAYDKIVSYYNAQPSLNARDSERLIKQQYSTPTPFGYVMGQFVQAGGKKVDSMLEPSAGNGALTITVNPSVVQVNDIDDARLANLRRLGYGKVTAQDALLPFNGEKADVVMTNPPFGTVTEKVYDGVFHISSLEGQMAINALEQMKDDGRAAIVIGGNTSYRTNGSMNPKDAAFFGYLYSHYNVVDVININGIALYSRNGTGYDVRMILIDGRKTGEFQRVFPPVKAKARAEQVTTFDELYKRVQDDIQQIQQVGDQSADVHREPETATDGTASAPIRSGNDRPNSGAGQRPGTTSDAVRDTPRTDSGQPATVNDGSRPVGVDNAVGGNGTGTNDVPRGDRPKPEQREQYISVDNGRGGSGNDGRVSTPSRPDGNRQRLAVKTGLGDEKVPYPNQSGNGFTLMSVVPAAQAQVLQKSLGEIGDVDQFLVDELGYSSKDELYGYLAAEQIDSVALAIHQMNKGNAFIIGDMTGVGKGRQGAALIRYAVKQGKVPIYFTQKPTLFTDNYRDLVDIGSSNLRPFIMASVDKEHSGDIVDANGNVVYKIPSKKEKERVYNHIINNGTLPPEYDYVLATYSQIQNGVSDYAQNEDGTWNTKVRKLPKKSKGYTTADYNGQTRRDALAKLAEGNIAILDESHTVGGDSGCGRYMQMLTSSSGGVTFLSATFAKRADNMPIYAQRTAIAEAEVKASELIDAIKKGGVTLQEIMSKQLVESGQMIRRERSFEGVTIDWLSVEEETNRRQREQFDEVAAIFNAIRNFQDDYITPIIDAKNEAAAEWGATVGHTQGTKDMGVKNVPFASKMYNLVNQLLFALKVDAVADRIVENLHNGYKPVISFTNTMEGFLSSAPKGVAMDEVPNFSLTLMRALDGVMRFTEKDADENTEGGFISLSELSADGQKAYNAIRDKIMNLAADLPISPMDAIRMRIEEAGYSVAEITGRTMQLNRTEDGKYIVEARKDRDKKAAMRDFNSGKLDVLMINKSGSTGISLHASSKFEDQRQRVMVFAQFQSDINDEVQMRGRIDRSGQVARGRYEYIMSTIPAEQRIQMMFKAKLKSLDANTTSSQKSKFNEMEIVDYLNKYGDEVVWEYMKEHPELEERLGDPLDMLQEKDSEDGPRTSEKEDTSKKTGCAGKISRYLAFLSVDEQDEIFKEITEAYRVKIQLLDDAGENDLEITTMPLRAETKRKQIWHEGVNPGSGNAFADNTYVEEVEVDVLKKPMKRDEIIEATRKLVGDKGIVTEYDQMRYGSKVGEVNWTRYAREKEAEISQFFQEKADEAVGKLREAGEARIAKAREKAVAAATKARGRGENNFTDAEIQSLADTVANEEREKEERKQDKRRSEIMSVKFRIQTLLNRLRAGSIYVVPQDLKQGTPEMFSQTFGTFVGFKFNKSYTLGSSTAIFATLDGRRKVELALSDPAINTIISATEMAYRYSPKEINAITMENWDSKVPTQTRQKRYIITGNLLQALVDTEKGEKTRGNLISYSTIDGETRQGILMGENFKPADLRNSAPLSSRLAQIREGQTVVSENGDVQISKELHDWRHRGEYELRVPKSKRRGGIYIMHPDLLKLVDDHNFITKGNNMVAYVNQPNIARVVDMLSREPFNLTVLQESQLTDTEIMERPGDGYGAYTDEEVSYLNDPVSKVMGKNRFSKKRQAEFAARERQRMADRIQRLAERMHLDNVEVVTDVSQFEGKRAKAKGFYNKRTGKITIVIPNNVSSIDAEQTLLHEAVAHYGLRKLFGEHFDTFLDNVYDSADEDIRKKIAEMAAQNGWNFRTATEEYLAGLAEDTNFEDARGYASGWWQRVKRLFIDMLERIGFEGFRDKVGVVLTDNELRYILWRSYENLAEPGRFRSILGEAKDVAMQSDLKVGNYAERGIEAEYAAEPSAITELSKRFDEALKQYEERRLPQGFRFELGMPSAYLKSAGFPNLPICMRATLLARKAGDERHPFEASDLKGLVEAIQQPIAIFEYSKPNMRNLIVDVKRGDKHFLVGVTLDYKAGDIEINSVSGLFPKESHEWIKWIQDGKAIRIDQKEKVQTIIDSLRTNPAESERIGLNLDDVTKIVKSFENPTVEEEELFRPGDFSPRDKALARHEYERIVSSGSYQFQEAVQDSMLGLKKLYQAILGPGKRIEDVVGFENAYLFENRMSSMNAGEQHEYFIRYMQPLLKEIGKICGADKRKRKELTDYLMAKHGLERNEYMRNEAAKNGEKTDRDFAGLIGLTGEADWQNAEDTARQWVDDYESMVDTAALWEAINKATKATLEKVYLSGIISKKTYEKILGMYDYYVPLRGWNETTSEQVYGYLTSKDGPLGGSIMKKAEGRESMADDPIATIGMMADDAIRQGNRNLMKQRFLNFILNHPSDAVSVHDIWLEYNDAMDEWVPVFADIEDTDTADEVAQKVEAFEQRMEALRTAEPDRYKKGREAQHIPYKVVRNNLREHQILIKRGGRTFVATINGNPRAAQAINGLTNPDVDQNGVVGNMLKAGTWINRQLSAFYTTRNPDFVVSNFFRDALYSNCMTWVKESPRYALRFHKNFGRLNPVVMRRLLGKWENGTLDMSDKYEKMFYQFMKNGAETGYTNVRDIEGHKRAVAAELKKQGSTGRKAWAALGMQLDLLNRSAENCARFAAFVTSREFGRSIDRAIYDAKEISVNFNKKGSGGKMVNANGQTRLGKIGAYLGGGGRLLYVFWNAGIQGMTNFARQAKLHPVKATAGASALMALGYAIPMLAEMLGGGDGDDDDKNAYYNLPEYIRRSNVCFYAGEQWVTIPLPIEYRAMYGMGELAYGVISGNERYSGMELGLQMAGQVTQLLPIDMLEGGGGISPFIPSAAKPFTEAYIMNKSWTGLPVYKDTAFNKDDPEWTKAYASADKHLVDFAKWLNEISGGDDYKKGYIDINPAKIEYLLNGTFGGMFTFPNKLNKTGETIFGDREFEWRNIPIANRLIKSGDERTANRKLQNEYFKYLKEYESTRKLMKKYENAADEGVIKYAEKVNFLENSPEYLRHEIFDSFKPDIDADREAIADAERSERATAENQMYADMRQLVNALHDPTAYFKNLYDAGLLDDEYIEWLKSHHGIKLK